MCGRPASCCEAFGNQPPNVKLLVDTTEPPGPYDLSQLQAGGRVAAMADFFAPELLAGRAIARCALRCLCSRSHALHAAWPASRRLRVAMSSKSSSGRLSEPARPLETMGVPQPLAQFVMYLMAKKPETAYQSAAQAAEQLALFVPPAGLSQSHAAAFTNADCV